MIIEATITAYCLLGTMASGKRVYDGAVACPREISLGTEVCIAGRMYVCEDRTHQKYNGRYDIWFPNCSDAIKFGKKKLNVTIYAKTGEQD